MRFLCGAVLALPLLAGCLTDSAAPRLTARVGLVSVTHIGSNYQTSFTATVRNDGSADAPAARLSSVTACGSFAENLGVLKMGDTIDVRVIFPLKPTTCGLSRQDALASLVLTAQ